MNRRQFLAASSLVALSSRSLLSAPAPASAPTTRETVPDDVVWRDVRDWGVEGRAFDDTESYFDRLPARAKSVVPSGVWNHSRSSTGMSARFEADTDAIFVRYELTSAKLAMEHMPATGVSGVDLYASKDGRWHWLATCSPDQTSIAKRLVQGIIPGRRAYQLNLPLYNVVKSLHIGLPKAATFAPIPPRKEKPILIYGTSITQGGCASRPGMAFVAILARRLDRPMLNFGFSGSGRMDAEVVQLLAGLDPAVFVLDCLANMGAVPVTERTVAAVRLLRKAQPRTPILLVEERPWTDSILLPGRAASHAQRCAELRAAFDQLVADGVIDLHYRTGDDLIGTDGEATVDGSHPTDLGMMRYADALEPDLRRLLKQS